LQIRLHSEDKDFELLAIFGDVCPTSPSRYYH
ncbi:hypothetical protein T02_11732, partial [Trichinella nativa]